MAGFVGERRRAFGIAISDLVGGERYAFHGHAVQFITGGAECAALQITAIEPAVGGGIRANRSARRIAATT